MAVGTVTMFDNAIQDFMDGSVPLWTVANSWYAVLYEAGSTLPLTSFTTKGAITHTEATSQTDYTRQQLGTCTIAGTAPQCEFKSAIVSFGSNVSLHAKYLIVCQNVVGSAADADELLFFVNLDTADNTSTEVSSTSAAFTVDDSANGWFYIA